MEGEVGTERSSVANILAVQRALEEAGVVFLDASEVGATGPGVRLRP